MKMGYILSNKQPWQRFTGRSIGVVGGNCAYKINAICWMGKKYWPATNAVDGYAVNQTAGRPTPSRAHVPAKEASLVRFYGRVSKPTDLGPDWESFLFWKKWYESVGKWQVLL